MKLSWTLSAYIGRQFLSCLLAATLALFLIVVFFDALETTRLVFRREESGGWPAVLAMVPLKAPSLLEKVVPYGTLLGAVFAFWRLNRHHEAVVVRAAGVSIWQFLLAPVLLAVAAGAFSVALFNPLSSALLLKHEILEARHVRGKPSLAALSNRGLWFRQATDDGSYVLHARGISMGDFRVRGVIVFRFADGDRFVARMDAPSATLEDGRWRIERPTIAAPGQRPRRVPAARLPTNLTRENMHDSFAPPEAISFWALPAFVASLENAGFSGVRHRLHWHAHLALPLTLAAVVLLAATFSLRPGRRLNGAYLLAAGVGMGFLLYFLTDLSHALGAASRIPVEMSAWSPALAGIMIGLALLLHLEDG